MSRPNRSIGEKPLYWIASSLDELRDFPDAVQDKIGSALSLAQFGGKHPSAKPWKGSGPGMFEIVEDYRSDAYRAIYTVQFADAVYVLHAFQKKSPTGIRTPKRNVELVTQRLKEVQREYETRRG